MIGYYFGVKHVFQVYKKRVYILKNITTGNEIFSSLYRWDVEAAIKMWRLTKIKEEEAAKYLLMK